MARSELAPALLLLAAAACSDPTSDTTSNDDSSVSACEGAALEYRDVCFRARSVEGIGFDHPFEIDGQPGDELVGTADAKVSVHRFDGEQFVRLGEAALPGEPKPLGSRAYVVAGEFDDVAGVDLVVSAVGQWAALYHLEATGAPTLAWQQTFSGFEDGSSNNAALYWPVAIGPDENGKWRIVGHFDSGEDYPLWNPLGLWEVVGTTLVDTRLELTSPSCLLEALDTCEGGDFDGDGRRDAFCSISQVEEACPEDAPEEQILHVVLLAQADGTVAVTIYPTNDITTSFFPADLDGDAITDVLGFNGGWYRLAGGDAGLGPVVQVDTPTPPILSWTLLTVGDVDGDQDDEILLSDYDHLLVVDNLVTAPESFESVVASNAEFYPYDRRPIDANGDGILDLPMLHETLLVSEVTP